MMKRKRIFALIGVALVLMLIAIRSILVFFLIIFLDAAEINSPYEKALTDYLKGSKMVVGWAVDDVDVHGGLTGGASAQILLYTSHWETAKGKLEKVWNDSSMPAEKRVVAGEILYARTKDRKILQQLYEIVQPAGGSAVLYGRGYIQHLVDSESLKDEIAEIPPSEPFNIPLETIMQSIDAKK